MKTLKAQELAIKFYEDTQKLTIPGHLRDQLNRSSSSIAINLAEGNAKYSFKDKKRIYQIAMGSLRESQVTLRLAGLPDSEVKHLSDHLAACIYKLTVMKDNKLS